MLQSALSSSQAISDPLLPALPPCISDLGLHARSPLLSLLGSNVTKTYHEDHTRLEQTYPSLRYRHQRDFKKGPGQGSALEVCPLNTDP